jgi:hypothetical protein
MEVKIGSILVAKQVCKMKDGSGDALIIDKEYPVKFITPQKEICIDSETDENHRFDTEEDSHYYYGLYFNLKK